MSKQKHARGPWKSRHLDYEIWDSQNCRWISVTAPKRGEIARFKRDQDAILAAAAPELLAFAEEWLASQGNDANYMTAKARAAIRKAKGE